MPVPRRTLAYVLLLLPLLVVLVVQQVRWLDELEEAQRDEMRRNLQSGLDRAAAELDDAWAERDADVPAAVVEAAITRALGDAALETYAFAIEPVDGAGPVYYRSREDDDPRPPDASAVVFRETGSWVGFVGDDGGSPTAVPLQLEIPVGASPATWNLVARHRDGTLAAVVARGRRRNLAIGGAILGLLCAGIGVLLFAEARARRLSEKERVFIAGVSHELRTPLAVIRSAASNIRSGVVRDGKKLSEYGALIEREVERVSDRVERVLRFSRDGNIEPSVIEDVAVSELVDDAVEGCLHWRDRREFDIDTELEPELPPLRGDRAALVSAVQNLLDNAIKYGPEGQTVRVRGFRRNGSELVLQVADEGDGIAEEDRERAFLPFYRGKAARRAGVTGSGLGLGVVARVVADHGGSVRLEEPATIALHLPLRASS